MLFGEIGYDIDGFGEWIPDVLDWFWTVLRGLWRLGEIE